MIVAIHQPAYLPWLGYLDRIAASDVFVLLDTVQYDRASFTSRNRIKGPGGPQWLKVPVVSKGHRGRMLLEIEIDNHQAWRRKHLNAISLNYGRSPYFGAHFPRLKELLGRQEDRLSELCFQQLGFWLSEFGIRTRVVRSSDLQVAGSKSALILAICRRLAATEYLSGPFGKNYLDEESFSDAGISVRYHEFQQPVYAQLFGDFVPHLSVVDYWMNCGTSRWARGQA